MTSEKLERVVQTSNGLFDQKGREIRATPIGDSVVLRGPVVGHEPINVKT